MHAQPLQQFELPPFFADLIELISDEDGAHVHQWDRGRVPTQPARHLLGPSLGMVNGREQDLNDGVITDRPFALKRDRLHVRHHFIAPLALCGAHLRIDMKVHVHLGRSLAFHHCITEQIEQRVVQTYAQALVKLVWRSVPSHVCVRTEGQAASPYYNSLGTEITPVEPPKQPFRALERLKGGQSC